MITYAPLKDEVGLHNFETFPTPLKRFFQLLKFDFPISKSKVEQWRILVTMEIFGAPTERGFQ